MDKYCKICKLIFRDLISLHRHFRSHKILVEDYYHLYFPRKDLMTGDLIDFKSLDFYFNHDFNDKSTMKAWLEKQPKEIVADYCKKILLNRKERKNLKYTPTQVELRSIMSPSILFFKKNFDDYYETCKGLGFINKFKNFNKEDFNKIKSNRKTGTIIIDTREQQEFKFDTTIKREKLNYGDYALDIPDRKVIVERKTLKDFVGTFSNYYHRFIKEIERAKLDNIYLVIVVENSINDCLSFNILKDGVYWRVTPDHIFHNVRDLIERFENVQFIFCKGKDKAANLTKFILEHEDMALNYDLQLLHDERILDVVCSS
ncbi:MAG: ERCC4 domain-containing protein [Nanoarchaeota archaeon]